MRPIVVDGPLGRWTHASCRPATLAGLVHEVWLFDGFLTNRRERTFPTGMFEIFVHLGDRYRVVEDRGVATEWICPDVCVTGLQTGPLVVESPAGRTKVLGVKLTPAGACALFARPLHDVTDLTVDLRDVSGAAAMSLAEACNSARTIQGCLTAAVVWLEQRCTDRTRVDPAIAWMTHQIDRLRGPVSIRALGEQTGISRTRLALRFQQQVGVSAKQYARVVRFRRLLRHLHHFEKSPSMPLAELAVDAGYYDQPHMNAEFKALSGLTPGAFLEARHYPNSVNVAEI